MGVIVTDLSLQGNIPKVAETLARISRHADVVWLDHHAPQWPESVCAVVQPAVARLVTDHTGIECGATMTMDFIDSTIHQPLGVFRVAVTPFTEWDRRAMRSVAHRDTWSDPDDIDGILYGLASWRLRQDFPVLVEHGEYRALRLLGEHPYRKRQRDLVEAMERLKGSGNVRYVLGGAPLSDLAHLLWKREAGARVLLQITEDGRLRIRSRPDTPVAQDIAQLYGGGGHAHAAGASLTGSRSRNWLRRRLKGLDPQVRRVVNQARMAADGVPLPGTAGRPERPSRRDKPKVKPAEHATLLPAP